MSRRRPHVTFGSVVSHLGVIVVVSVVLGVLTAGLAVPVVGALGLGTKAAADSMKNLPEELKAEPLAQRTRVLDSKGDVIATFYAENRVNVELSEVAPIMRRAIVAIEDYRFFQHGALDLKGTLRAFVNNQTGDSTQGGSSITQQMAKMTLLTQAKTDEARAAATENTYQRKIQELRHAIAFEENYSKSWILERYLNLAYFGDGAYGIQAAARHYFSVPASELNAKQAATLAGLVKNPVGFDPTRFPDRTRARRDVVLQRMGELDVITPARAEKLSTQKLGLKVSRTRNGCLGTQAPFFCDYVRRYLLADPALGRTVADRDALLKNGGLTIKTTLDLDYQRAADAATADAVDPTDTAIGALAMVQPGTGEVRAVSQSRPMGREKSKGETYLNYAVDTQYGDANGFQAGSTFKAFVLAAALEQGIPVSTTINSPETISIPQNRFSTCEGQYPITSPWEPSNSTTSGSKNLTTGTRESVNTFFAQLEERTGLCEPYALAKAMGIDLTDPGLERVPSFVLGIADTSPLELATAYATFAARGTHCDARPVTQVLNSDGKVFKDYPAKCEQVIKQSTADNVNAILRGVLQPGGFGQALALDKPSAGKTGTINSNMAVWFAGYTPTMSTAAMIAGADQDGNWVTLNNQTVGGSYVYSAAGSTLAGPMWASAMRAISGGLPYEDFTTPSSTPEAPIQVGIDDVKGLKPEKAAELLSLEGFLVSIGTPQQSDERKGRVAGTSPSAGMAAPRGTAITIYPSAG
ncbi:Membrane carboxypeptidase (penicillin-binding protein) [Nocardioides scoriae]|uniref:Membrane carboxypeptidase (Penicillin-binding protein) n=1 Tax=Nocardioides scoriae TaxID=642780 RepID=A0A1H1UHT3_9ACTN|nr:transglycosylase domain-containing protein [Nocardioides scoriae]SDS71746.1 Membrane carboxypeptidase (penicillin-binding protein) [Nocardioides scoriae]